jgi:hypothetical protein
MDREPAWVSGKMLRTRLTDNKTTGARRKREDGLICRGMRAHASVKPYYRLAEKPRRNFTAIIQAAVGLALINFGSCMGFYKDSHIKTQDLSPHNHDFFMPNKENNLKGSLFKNQKFSRLRSRPI